MSRRIATAFALAACAVVITPALADRECFDNSCRMPDVTDQPTEVVEVAPNVVLPSPDIDTPPAIVEEPRAAAAPAPVTAPPTATPGRPLPRIAEPRVPRPVPPIKRYEQSPPAPRHQPPRYAEPKTQRPKPPVPSYADDDYTRRPKAPVPTPAPRHFVDASGERIVLAHRVPPRVVETVEPVYVVNQGPTHGSGYARPGQPVYVVNQGPTHGSGYARTVTVVGPTPVYGGGAAIAVYPQMRPDPAWKLCQIDAPGNNYCVPYSYHPYGPKGYRPMGSYRPYYPAQAHMQAPDARIISIEAD
jgi:hypothetical protein